MEEFKLRDDDIKLGQLLKAAGLTESGVDSKFVISVQVHECLVFYFITYLFISEIHNLL